IRLLQAMRLATVKKTLPAPKFDRKKLVADLVTLQSVVTNRYDVMAKYTKSVKQAWYDEIEHLKTKANLESRFLKSAKKLLQHEPTKLEAPQRQQLSELF